MAGLQITEGQLQQQANVLTGYANDINSAKGQFNGAVADMQAHLQGSAGTAYQSVSSNTLTPQLTAFVNALNTFAGNLTAAGASFEASNSENTSKINSMLSSAQSTFAAQSSSNLSSL